MTVSVTLSGSRGKNLNKYLRGVKHDAKGYDIGWPKDGKYPSGQTFAEVALYNNFGVPGRIPARPFFNQANRVFDRGANFVMERLAKASNGTLTRKDTRVLGMWHRGILMRKIRTLASPANAPETIDRKKSSNPLIDTGTLRRNVIIDVVE